jgi:spore maturation protein CgeB
VRLLLIHPGASFSTHDIFVGYADALTQLGHTVLPYRLDQAIDDVTRFAKWKARRGAPAMPGEQVFFEAGARSIISALYKDVDWVIVVSAMYLHPDVLIMLKRAGLKVALILTESPYDDVPQQRVAPYADAVFTNERTSVERLRAHNPNIHYLPHAYNPALHYPADPPAGVPQHDVVFVGSLFQERVDLLSAVDWTGIDFGLYGSHTLLGSRSKLRRYVKAEVISNTHAANLYRAAKIGLNLYRTSVGFGRDVPRVTQAESLNPRAYELAACGVFQMAEYRAEVRDILPEGTAEFRSPEEFGFKLRHFLGHGDRRLEYVGNASQFVHPHTYLNRASQLMTTLEMTRVAGRTDRAFADRVEGRRSGAGLRERARGNHARLEKEAIGG